MNNHVHIMLVSGGLASFEATRRVLEKIGKENLEFWFFDTLMEDEDLYRFLDDIERVLKINIQRFSEGRNPWEVFRDKRFIGNTRTDLCSRILKREFLEGMLKQFGNRPVTLYFGLEWSEGNRIARVERGWADKGYSASFPLTWEPILFPQDFAEITKPFKILPPRLYKIGFSHNNCGGACVKAGIKQWTLLYQKFPERYRWHEEQEQKTRKLLRKNVSILRDRRGGKTTPLTLKTLRSRLEKNKLHQKEQLADDASCSCFVESN